jgi:hypothetical protein
MNSQTTSDERRFHGWFVCPFSSCYTLHKCDMGKNHFCDNSVFISRSSARISSIKPTWVVNQLMSDQIEPPRSMASGSAWSACRVSGRSKFTLEKMSCICSWVIMGLQMELKIKELADKLNALAASQTVLELLALSLFDGIHDRPRAIKQFSETTERTIRVIGQSESETFRAEFLACRDTLLKKLFDAYKGKPKP